MFSLSSTTMFWMISHWASSSKKPEHYFMTSRVTAGEDKRELEQKLGEDRAGNEVKMFADKIEREKNYLETNSTAGENFPCAVVPQSRALGKEPSRSRIPLTLQNPHSQEAVGCLASVLHQPQKHPSVQCPGSFKDDYVSSKTGDQVFCPVPHKSFL